ncbi:MAG: sigma-70 family RNA polymerase sigma factor [Acidobacteriaceae bacterium]|nr:sigma-70 family RNA polymerase sigma factor [Acidobacteriaceae bacterium]MBV8572301.1 sigma-70 family RNA polymerase sigma factor [Acidobacteriaceae bacterium]
MGELTALLRRWSSGDRQALDELIPIVYDELKRLAGYHLRLEEDQPSLTSTAIVHEAYLRLVGSGESNMQDRQHFFAVASRVIRHILVDHARRHVAAKRDLRCNSPLEQALTVPAQSGLDLVELDQALERLGNADPDKLRVVELRFFGGLSIEETAEVMRTSPATVKREWSVAKIWLYEQMQAAKS